MQAMAKGKKLILGIAPDVQMDVAGPNDHKS